MALINFGYRVDMSTIPSPLGSASFLVAYDLDGVLKQKDYQGIVSNITGGSQVYNSVNIYSTQSGAFTLQDGSENAGYFLKSDGNGTAQWAAIDTTDVNTLVSATYSGLKTLVNNNGLIVGASYILTDYQTIYQINNSDSSDISFLTTCIGESSTYSQLVPSIPTSIGGPGDYATVTVVVDSIPSTASTVYPGLTLSIVNWFNGGYIRFSPQLTGVNNHGVKLKFLKKRYNNVNSNGIYLDNYGKPIMKPGGVINVDVHDGTPYMSMTASENPIPVMESLILTAIDINKFSRNAESLTYHGDKIIYDFLDDEIYDENGIFLRNRPGNIKSRTNIDNSISINKDWRIQRYRRYGVDNISWEDLTLAGTSSGSYIYKIPATASGINMCTVVNTSITNNHKYISPAPYMKNFYINFSKNNAYNIFLSGTTSNTSNSDGSRGDSEVNLEYNNDLTISGFTQSVKDFTILPLIDNQPDSTLIIKCIINDLNNTVFLPYTTSMGLTSQLFIDSLGTIQNSTFVTLPSIINNGTISQVTAIDRIDLSVYNSSINNSIFLSTGTLKTSSNINRCTFGSGGSSSWFNIIMDSGSELSNTIIGGRRYNRIKFINLTTMNSLIVVNTIAKNNIMGYMYLTLFKIQGTITGTDFKLNTYANTNPNKPGLYGYMYDFSININDSVFDNNTLNKRLVYKYLDNSNNIISVTASAAL